MLRSWLLWVRSLADRAWGRETAVYRITGVITVVGGWFITAGAAFIMAFLIGTLIMSAVSIAMAGNHSADCLHHDQQQPPIQKETRAI